MATNLPSSALGYRPALDGIRAVAVIAVLAGHSGWMSGGFLGVDVFFALSGFLITSLLLDEFDARGTIALSLFYARRALRLLPALSLFLVVCTGITLSTVPPEFGPLALQQAAVVAFYIANWAWAFGLSTGILGHTWSLAIEEQFYLLWPLALFGILRLGVRRGIILGVTLAGITVGVLWRMVMVQTGASLLHVHQGTDTHGDALLIGCAAALAVRMTSSWIRGVGWASAAVLVTLFTGATFPDDYLYRHASTVTAAVSAVLIIDIVQRPKSWLGRGFAAQPLAALGRMSYGVYLWHFPVFFYCGALAYAGATPAPWPAHAVAWGTTMAAAILSYVALERPILAFKATVRPASVAVRAGLIAKEA